MIREIELYPEPIREGEIIYDPIPSNSENLIEVYKKHIDEIIQEKMEELGYNGLKALDGTQINSKSTRYLPKDKRVVLNDELREDERILDLVLLIFELNGPKISKLYNNNPKKLVKLIELLDWNDANKSKIDKIVYDGRTLTVRGLGLLHSYVVQAIRKPEVPKGLVDSPSISGIILSVDDPAQFPIGYRAGGHFDNTGMTVPAGSVDINYPDPIFNSFYKELIDEIGLTRDDIIDAKIIGKIFDPYVGGNSLFVILAQSKLSYQEINGRFEKGPKDRFEHKKLIPVAATSEEISKNLRQHDLWYDKKERPEFPDQELPYLYPLKQSLIVFGMHLDPTFSYEIVHKM